ncbi:PR-1-like protein, partial [Ceratobasidium sp. AG-I]
YLKGHNDIRAQHGAVALTWADDLAAAAAKWAGNCVWEHSQGKVGSFGENLAAGTGLTAAAAVKMWTDESVDYDPANPQYSHFTQVVWKGTTEVGCAVTSCTGLLTGYSGAVQYHVCEYRAPGNVIGQFA